MKRIVFNGRFLAQPTTGVQRYGRETLAALDRLLAREPALRRGARWQLALPHDAADPPLVDHFEIETLQFLRGHAWEQLALARFARGAYLINPGYSGPVTKTRQMITVHDAGIAAHPQTYRAGYRWFGRAMMAALGPRVDTVVTMSHFSAGELRTHFGLVRDDVVVGRSGWEHVRDAPAVDDAAVLRRHGLHSGGYLLAVGSLKANKNFAVVPRALQKLGPGLRLPLAVVGARDDSVYQGVEPPVAGLSKLLGFVPDEDLYALYRHAAWFVFPSVYEGFGLPPLEALANGCPVLAAHAASIPEVYGDAVLYFDPHDPASLATRLQEVLNHPDPGLLRRTLQRRARARLDLYRWDANARILADRLIAVGALEPAHQAGPAHAPPLHAAHH